MLSRELPKKAIERLKIFLIETPEFRLRFFMNALLGFVVPVAKCL